MNDRNRQRCDQQDQDWASQVPWHYDRHGPYEDWGWERGESALPEFRDPSVHEHRPPRNRNFSGYGQSEEGHRSSGAMNASRRAGMQNPYDYDMNYDRDADYERDQFNRINQDRYGRDYDRNRRGMNQSQYGRDFDDDRTYQGQYGRDYDRNRGGMNQYGRSGFGRNFDYDRNSYFSRNQRGYDRNFDYDRGINEGQYGRDFDYDRGGMNEGQSRPMTWTYTEYWLIPGPYSGRGPQGYRRSDERIMEDVCERLTQHGQLDASNIKVDVNNGEVTLTGNVRKRQDKRLAEDMIESISGVSEVHNQLRVQQDQQDTTMRDTSIQKNTNEQSGMRERSVGGSETQR